ncbi:MAG: retropepsin-like aspartic protease [Vulcanimicrobiaceae bacterium]
MENASGGPYVAQIVSVWNAYDQKASSVVTTTSQGIDFLSRRCLGVLCEGRYFDGDRLYAVDANNDLLPLVPGSLDALRDLRSGLALMFLAHDFQHNGGRIRLEPPFHQLGKARDVLQIRMPDGRMFAVWVDPSTALVTRIDLGFKSVRLRDYRRVGPYMMPFKEIESRVPERIFSSRTIIAGNLHAPTGMTATLLAGSPGASRIRGSILPIFDCRLANVATRCILDTGNSGMALSLHLAERLKAPVVGAATARGLGTYATEVVRAGPLSLGNADFGVANYLVLPDISGLGFDVIVGNAVFASLSATLDSRHLRFGTASITGNQPIAVSFPSLLPDFLASIGGQSAHFTLDTGDEAGFDLSAAFVKTHPGIFTRIGSIAVKGIGGIAISESGRDQTLGLGACSISAFPTQLTAAMPTNRAGRIGAHIFDAMSLHFDYPHGRIEFSPIGKTVCTPPSP